jgi:aspartate aminotransferase
MKLADRIAQVSPSPTLALNAKAKALAAAGKDVCSFAAGEPDFDTPDHIKEAAKKALDEGFTKYTATGGIPELKAAIQHKFKRDNQLAYAQEEIVVTVGGKQALYNCFQALLSPGDEVIIFAPYWVSYVDMVRLAGGTPVVVQTSVAEGFIPTPASLEQALSPRTKAVILNSPSNPTGAVASLTQLKALGQVLQKHPCLIITDDIYERLLYTKEPFVNMAMAVPELKARTLIVNGLSKAYSMTGWRLGFAAGPKALIAGMLLIQDQSTSNANSISQKAGVVALENPINENMIQVFQRRRDLMTTGLNNIPGLSCGLPLGAFYCFVDVSALLPLKHKGVLVGDSLRLSTLLLEEYFVAGVPGDAFGAPGFLRLSFATGEKTIESGLARLRQFRSELTA